MKSEGETRIVEYHGGDYAATEFVGIQTMLKTWKALYKRSKDHYKIAHHQPLEIITGNLQDVGSL